MTTHPSSAPEARLSALSIARVPRYALAVVALAALTVTALEPHVVAPAAHSAIPAVAPVSALQRAPHDVGAAAARANQRDQDEEDDPQADEDAAPAEPVLEQIPVVPASDPQSLDV